MSTAAPVVPVVPVAPVAPVAPTAAAPAAPGAATQSPSVYVGDLDPKVTEAMLYDHFRTVGPVVSVRVCLDSQTHKSLGYGYVNFQNPADAERAIDQLTGSRLVDRCCRVSKIQRDPTQRKSGLTNVVVKGLPTDMDGNALKELFGKFGRIVSIKVPTAEGGDSRGYAYVMFDKEESARLSVEDMNETSVNDCTITVENYKNPSAIREEQVKQFTNLYIKNLSHTVDDEQLRAAFAAYGEITSAKVRAGTEGEENLGFGFVAFAEHDDAVKALEAFTELAAEGAKIGVKRFMNKNERQRAREQAYRERQATYAKFPNLYVKNFDDNITTEQLQEVFDTFGPTISVKVQYDPITKVSRGFGFVSYKDHASAQKAVTELAGSRVLGSRPLFVTYALRRDARRQQFEDLQKKRRIGGGAGGPPGMYPGGGGGGMGGGGMGGPGGMMMQPGQMGGNSMMFGGAQGQQQQMQQQQQQQLYRMQQQQQGMGGVAPGPQMQQRPQMMMQPGQMPPQGMPQGGMPMMAAQPRPMVPRPQPKMATPAPTAQPTGLDAQYLASMNADQQKNVLGERLYMYIVKKYPRQAAKITGMLLEMDNAEILNLLDSPQLLESKIDEALEVLERHDNSDRM
jgi:polyadenylate-binding protein